MDKIESMGSLESRQVNTVTLYNTNNQLNVHGFINNKKSHTVGATGEAKTKETDSLPRNDYCAETCNTL